MRYSCYVSLLLEIWILRTHAEERHGVRILEQPRGINDASCGDDITMACIATTPELAENGSSIPDVEWWLRNKISDEPELKKIWKKERISINTEAILVIQSTLIIRSANLVDEGVYQCRASASPQRHAKGVNQYQHWKIEEAPITNMNCYQDNAVMKTDDVLVVTSHAQVNAANNNKRTSLSTSNTVPLTTTTMTSSTTIQFRRTAISKISIRRSIKRQPKRTSHPSNLHNGTDAASRSRFQNFICIVLGVLSCFYFV